MRQLKKILILDRDKKTAEYLMSFVPLLSGYEIKCAYSAIDLLARINVFEPELLIYELNSSYPYAKDVLIEIRKKHPRTEIITMITDPLEEARLKSEGFCHIMLKPFDLTDLSRKIMNILPAAAIADPRPEQARLLVVDDEPGISSFIGEIFKNHGLEVYTTTDSKVALKLFKENACNLAIVDIRMPQLSGDQLIKLFQESTTPPPPKAIVIITAALGDSTSEIQRLGYPVIEKPMNIKVLEGKILEACQMHQLSARTD